ncbi:MAG: PAS domain S-box protein [Candidatus Eremiobacteraeota bacterium]|nr:PAS domain S-box protein [Candidatus Eremiobacteraeota bacterium]
MRDFSAGLDHRQLMEAFPFHVVFGPSLEVLQAGPSLAVLLRDDLRGKRISDFFTFRYPEVPFTFESVREHRGLLFILEYRERPVILRGQMMHNAIPEYIIFLCSLWVTEPDSLRKLGLSLHDFALHDPVNELLQVLEIQKTAVQDAKKAAEKLSVERKRLRATVETSLDSLVSIDRAGRITEFNSAAEKIFGYRREEIIGKTIADTLVPESHRQRHREGMKRHLDTGESAILGRRIELPALRADGTEFPAEVSITRFEIGDEPHFTGFIRDITERRKAEADLLEEHRIFMSGPVVVFKCLAAPPWPIEYISPNVTQFGYRVEEFLEGKVSYADLIHPDDQKRIADEETLYRVSEAAYYRLDYRIICKNGEVRWVTDYTFEIRNASGTVTHLHGYILDITDRKTAESSLSEREEHLRSIVNNVIDGIITTDHRGVIRTVNRAAESIFGYRAAELVGNNVTMVIPAAYREQHDSSMEEYLRTRKAKIIGIGRECEGLRKDGTTFPIDFAIGEMYQGDQLMFTGIVRDITERKRAEEKITQKTSELQAIFNAFPDLFFRLDASGVILDYISGKSTDLYLEPSHFIGKKVQEILPAEVSGRVVQGLTGALASGTMASLEYSLPMPGGEAAFEARFMALSQSQVIAIVRNITERRKMEEELKKAKEEAESSNLAKSEFLANMSHDIRTPMTAIIGMTELARDAETAADQQYYLSLVKNSAEALLALMNQILDLSKLEAGQLNIDEIPFRPAELVEQVMSLFRIKGQEKNIALSSSVEESVPEYVRGDPALLRQILINLCGNAVKFTEKGGIKLTVASRETGAKCVHLLFRVSDTGIGIPKDKLGSIFGRFTQADSSISRRFGGTGLGLYITQNLVEALKGTIKVESVEGAGTTFSMEIPFQCGTVILDEKQESAAPAEHAPSAGKAPGGQVSILIAEDSRESQVLLSTILKKAGHAIALAESGTAAVELFRRQDFDLVLMDLHMPEMDGLEATRRIRGLERERGSRRVPIIALTAHAMAEYRNRAFFAGMDDYLTKPFTREVLLQSIQRWLLDLPTILVVEDTSENLLLIERYLKKETAWRVIYATTGRDGLSVYLNNKVELVITDIEMPVMNGIEMVKAIRESGGRKTPVIAMTAHSDKEEIARIHEAGCDVIVQKPLRREILLDVIRQYMSSRGIPGEREVEREEVAHPAPVKKDMLSHIDGEILSLIPLYLDNRRRDAAAIEEYLSAANFPEIRKLGHKMKGSGGMYGLDNMTVLGSELEKAAKESDSAGIMSLFARLKQEIDRIDKVLKAR